MTTLTEKVDKVLEEISEIKVRQAQIREKVEGAFHTPLSCQPLNELKAEVYVRHDGRLRVLENWRWYVIGGAALLLIIVPIAIAFAKR